MAFPRVSGPRRAASPAPRDAPPAPAVGSKSATLCARCKPDPPAENTARCGSPARARGNGESGAPPRANGGGVVTGLGGDGSVDGPVDGPVVAAPPI